MLDFFRSKRSKSGHPSDGTERKENSWPLVPESRDLLIGGRDPGEWLEGEFDLRQERELKKMRKQMEAKLAVLELGTRLVESKQQLSLTALQAAADTRLQRLQIEAHVMQTEAALLETIEQAKAKLRRLKLAKLADEVGIPLDRLRDLLAADQAQKNSQANSLSEEEI